MKDNEFFKIMSKKTTLTHGEEKAICAWEKGIALNENFPLLVDFFGLWHREIKDFLETIKKSGLKKFGFFSTSTQDCQHIVAFIENGWKIAGTFEFDRTPFEKAKGLIFELSD